MMTIIIQINGKTIFVRSAVNKSPADAPPESPHRYAVDDGSEVFHVPKQGAVALAKKLLDTIKEP